MGHVLTENLNGLVVDARLAQAGGTAERQAAQDMVRPGKRRRRGPLTVGGDKAFDTHGFVAAPRALGVTPHVAQNNQHRSSAIDARTTRHKGCQLSQWKRKQIKKVLGWRKTVRAPRKTRHRGVPRVGRMFVFCPAVFDMLRIRNIEAAVA